MKQTGSKEHTTEGAGERQAGVMRDLPSSVLHICRVHREDVLRKKQTHDELVQFQQVVCHPVLIVASSRSNIRIINLLYGICNHKRD